MEKDDEDKKVDNMIILYETKDGELNRTDNHRDIPIGCKRIIIKYLGDGKIRVPECEMLIINLGYTRMYDVLFKCDVLKVYNAKCSDFSLHASSKVVKLRHLDMSHIRYMDYGFMGSFLRKTCQLDFKNVISADNAFANCRFYNIPDMINYSHIKNNIFDENDINKIKLSAWKKMMKIKR